MGVIYLRTNLVNGMQYVGRTKNLKRRESVWNSLNRKVPYANDFLEIDRKKYGLQNFKTEILEECDNSKLDELERFWIKQLNTTYPSGYNLENGGTKGVQFHPSTIAKLSKAKKGTKHTDEWKKNMSERNSGDGNPFAGKHHTKETIEKLKIALSGRPSWNKGKKLSDEQKRKSIEASKKRRKVVYQYTLEGELFAVYLGRNEAAKITCFDKSCIGAACNNKYYNSNKYKGYIWSYIPL